jgi:hypothetical protein
MSLFKHLEGDVAIIQSGGVYKQVDLYTRNGFLYAALSSNAFIRLKADGSTSKPNTTLLHIETELALHHDSLGRLGTKQIPDAKPLSPTETQRLMLAA